MLRSRVLVSTQTLSNAPSIECRLLTILFCFWHFPAPQNYIPALNFQELNPNITIIVHYIFFLKIEMIQNLSHKHALLDAFAEILPRGSVLLCFTRLTHTAINFPQRQIFGLLTSIYWTLTEVAWDGAIYWRSYLPQCSTCQDQVEGIDERMMSGRRRKMSFFVCCGFSTSSSTDGTSYVLRFLKRVRLTHKFRY